MNIVEKVRLVGLLVGTASLLLSIGVQAEDLPRRGPIPFAAFDQDGNGTISQQEFNTVRGERMAKMATEGRPMRNAANAPAFSEFDADGDGQLTKDELIAGQRAQFEKRRAVGSSQGQRMGPGAARNAPAFSDFDLDGNGKIVEGEFNEARSKRMSDRAQQGYPMRNLANAPSFADFDADGNGEISSEEFAEYRRQRRQPQTP